jgi:uncharacterized protein
MDTITRRQAASMSAPDYLPRIVDLLLEDLMADHPAVLIVGPRASGKTTTARRHTAGRIRLDRPAEAVAARADPDAAIADGPFPLLIDEWQLAPDILGAVKRAVDERPGPGRFVVTGSAQADLAAAGWPATGRLIRTSMYGLAEREIDGHASGVPLIDRLLTTGPDRLSLTGEVPDGRGYVARALRGGFPETALMTSERARQRWLASYVDQVVTRDVSLLGTVRDPVRLRRYLQALAASTAGIPALKTLADTAGIDQHTAVAYDSLLESLLITASMPAWSTNRLNRLIRQPKRYLIDPAFLGPLLGIDGRAAIRDGDLLGRILDTLVVAQLRADAEVSDFAPRFFHVRDANGRHEVDVLAELRDGRVVGIEIKATAAPTSTDARHLRWLKEGIGDLFALGLVLHTGPAVLRLDEGIWAAPISSLWT